MKIKELIKKFDFSLSKEELLHLKKETENFIGLLKGAIEKKGIDAEVFVGGSFAKGTLGKSKEHDIDIFIRFDWKYENLSGILEEILNGLKKHGIKYEKMRGSRDYFRIEKGKKLTFEVVPVLKIKKPREERNVTDLSYFHVNYVKKRLNERARNEILLLKKFCKAQKVYGAESYINGFSGYAVECLIIYYNSFEKTLKELIKVKENERLVIDPSRHYKNKNEVFVNINENKIKGPIVLVDPTWKERNVLSALNLETFKRFQEKAKEFLEKPSEKFFVMEKFDEKILKENARKKKTEFLKIVLKTEKQEGDIAGTKMRKFSRFLLGEIKRYFNILDEEFIYEGKKEASFYLLLKGKKEVVKIGPPLDRKEDVIAFKKINKETFEKNGFIHFRIKIDFTGKEFLREFVKKEKNKKMREMGIIGMKIRG